MASSNPDPFVRLSTPLLEAFFAFHLTGVQLRTILWVLRNTDGWNRKLTPFRWRQIANKLGTGPAVVWRAGQRLLQANVLLLADHQLGIQKEAAQWRIPRLAPAGDGARQLTLPERAIAWEQLPALPGNNAQCCLGTTPALPTDNASVAGKQRFSVERKTDVKTIQKRRRGGGYVDNVHASRGHALRELLNFYGTLRGKALSSEEATGFSPSAKALLDGCSNNLQEAKACLTQSFTKPGTRGFVPISMSGGTGSGNVPQSVAR